MSSELNNVFHNPYFQQVVFFLIEHILQRTHKKLSQKTAQEVLAEQLLSCLKQAYFDTCQQFNWECNDSAIEEQLINTNPLSLRKNTNAALTNILLNMSGADESGIASEDIIQYWHVCFMQQLSCKQELYNFLSCNIIDKPHPKNNHTDNEMYQEAFFAPLFLEEIVSDGNTALLKDVYIPAQYKVNSFEGEKRIDFATMLNSFFNARDKFTWQQDSAFPTVSKKIFSIMIMGKPGSGKSSFVSYLSTLLPTFANNRPYFIVRLRNLQESQINNNDPIQGLLDYLDVETCDLINSIVILDGLDEICALYHKTNFHMYLERLLHNLSQVQGLQLVLTSRTGYFRVDSAIESFCLILHIENWNNHDLECWSENYKRIHPKLREVIECNNNHLKEEKYSDKKAIFAVPILFYMANARGELLSKHKSISSVYDAVLNEVSDLRHYDESPFRPMGDMIPKSLARQICVEIAFSMFRNGRLSLSDQSDPYLGPDEVDKAVVDAMQECASTIRPLSDEEKKKIKDTYALTFYYNKNKSEFNAVEFAHKTIAEFFTAEKLWEILKTVSEDMSETELCGLLAECFGYAPVTADINLFLFEKLKMEEKSKEYSRIKKILEKFLLKCVLDGNLFSPPKKHKSTVHYIDRISIMMRSVLTLFEYLNCQPPKPDERQRAMFNNVIATVSRMAAVNYQHQSMLPLALNGFNLSDGDFTDCELSEVHLSGADLTHAVFVDANLTDGTLNKCIVNLADFSGANLAGTEFTQVSGHAVDFTEAAIQGADFSQSKYYDTSFDYADMSETNMADCVFGKGCHFNETNLHNTNLNGTAMNRANIKNAVFFDQEKADCEDEAGQNSISHLQLTQKQYNYISSYPQIELKECKIVNNNKRKKE